MRILAARDLRGLAEEIRQTKVRFILPENAPVLSCYEAGRDGFWLDRYFTKHDAANLIVDSAALKLTAVRRAKTDRLEVGKLLTMLMMYSHGEV